MIRSVACFLFGLSCAIPPPSPASQNAVPKAAEVSVDEGANQVLTALVVAAETNSSLPTQDEKPDAAQHRLTGDRLTEFLVRSAARESAKLPAKIVAESFLLAVGIGLDDSGGVVNLPFVARRILRFETPQLRKRRLASLGEPTMREGRDLCQHFAVSLTLAVLWGAPTAEAAGFGKEVKDMDGESGFSFDDLQADLAGIAFQLHVCQGDAAKTLEDLANSYSVVRFLPDHQGLPSGLSSEQFKRRFGDTRDDRCKQQMQAIRKAIHNMYRTDRESPQRERQLENGNCSEAIERAALAHHELLVGASCLSIKRVRVPRRLPAKRGLPLSGRATSQC